MNVSRLLPLSVFLAASAFLAEACAPPPPPEQPPTTASPSVLPPPVKQPVANSIRIQRGDNWVDTTCRMLPRSNYWHAPVDHLPTKKPFTPDGSDMDGFPKEAAGPFEDPLRLGVSLRGRGGRTINWTDSDDAQRRILVRPFAQNAEYTSVTSSLFGSEGYLTHRVPNPLLTEPGEDGHAVFVDTDECTAYEHMEWNTPLGDRSKRATVIDLERNERRLSSRAGWLGNAQNGPEWQPPLNKAINSRYVPRPASAGGIKGIEMYAARGTITSAAGSGLHIAPSMLRVDEVFRTPMLDDQAVDPDRTIDHAIGVVIPAWNITTMPTSVAPGTPAPFVWPAVRSDGCGGGGRCVGAVAGAPSSAFHVPMGSRLRLSAEKCATDWDEPQAKAIADALCTYGVVVIDSSNHFALGAERSPATQGDSSAGSKWRREAEVELSQLTLRDFELVDMSSIAVVDPDAVWESAVTWATARYGANTELVEGWYDGTFWGSMLRCDRGPVDVDSQTRPPCFDPVLRRADEVANSPDWSRTDLG